MVGIAQAVGSHHLRNVGALVSTVFYTGINVPYAALNGLMTQNPYERGLLGNFRMLLSTAGSMSVNTFVLKLILSLGDGDQWAQSGWTKT